MKMAVEDVQTTIRKFHAESRAHLLRLSAVADEIFDEIFQAMSIAGIAIPLVRHAFLEPWSLRKRKESLISILMQISSKHLEV